MKIRQDVLKLAMPILTEQTFLMSMGVINTIMSSHIGKEAVSAIGMVDSLSNILIALFSSLAVGGTVVVAHYSGKNDTGSANEAAAQALFSGLILAVLTTLVTWIFQGPIINVLYGSAESEVIKNSFIYLNITLMTYPFMAITSIACGILRGAGDTRTPAQITILMNIMNIIFSYILIYGLHVRTQHISISIPDMGVKGAALGIAIARIAGAVLILLTLIRGSKTIKLINVRSFRINLEIQKSIFGIGIPTSVETLMFNGGKLITQIFVVGMGTASIAANYISSSFIGFVNIPGSALGIAATTLVGQSMGRGEREEAEDTLTYLVKLSSVSFLVLCIPSFFAADLLASMYTKDPEIIALTSRLIKICALTLPLFWAPSFLLPAGLRGAGDAKYTMVTAIIGMWAFRIVLGYILGVPMKLGVEGVWIGMVADWAVRGLLYSIRLRNGKWKKNVVIKESVGQAV